MKKFMITVTFIFVSVFCTFSNVKAESLADFLLTAAQAQEEEQTSVANADQTAEASAFACFNSTKGNIVLGVDSYNSILLGLYYGALNSSFERLERLTATKKRPDLRVYTAPLQEMKGYENAILALTASRFNTIFKNRYEEIGAKFSEEVKLNKSVANINYAIERQTGLKGVLKNIPNDPNGVLLLSVSKQHTAWKFRMKDSTMDWNHKKRVQSIVGQIEVATSTAPNGSTIFHLRMEDGVVMSIIFNDDDETGIGEWLAESIQKASNFENTVVEIPVFEIESEINFKDFSPLKFLFTDDAELLFGNVEQKLFEARQISKIVLNNRGLDAVSVTYAETISKGLFIPPKAELKFDRPFTVVWSYISPNGEPMPTFAARVVNPSSK